MQSHNEDGGHSYKAIYWALLSPTEGDLEKHLSDLQPGFCFVVPMRTDC